MWISALLFAAIVMINAILIYRTHSWKFLQVKAPESVYRRAVNWGWELANKLKNHRKYSDDEVFQILNEFEQ